MSLGSHNKDAFSKKGKYKLCIGVLAVTLAVGSVFGAGIVGHNILNSNDSSVEVSVNDEDSFAEINCNFIDYENLDDDEHVTFIDEDGNIVGYTDINNKGETGNLSVYLEPGKYYAINGTGKKKTMIEFEVKDPSEEYTLDIDCNDGSMELHNSNNTKKL